MTGKTVQVLLVEDDDIDAECVTRAFDKARIANPVTRAKDGLHALDILRGTNGEEKIAHPRLLLVDINMPRMDGIELIKELRNDEALKQTLAFILTTSKSEEDKIAAYDLNVAGYLIKSEVGNNFIKMVEMFEHYWRVIEFPA